jgi:hypothetical protein
MDDLQSYTLALLPLVKGDNPTVALRVSENGGSRSADKAVGSKNFDRVAHELVTLFNVPEEVVNLARKGLNDGHCVTINFDGSRADLVRVGFIEVKSA